MQSKSSFLENKNILITGGTGSIGSAVLDRVLRLNPNKVVVFSRDEYKQHQLKYKYADKKNIAFLIGDVRDAESVNNAAKDIDIIFHCAALKHVPISEQQPEEFIKTNILGSINVKKAGILNSVDTIVSISSDKAVNPQNVMGLTKAIQEKIFQSEASSVSDNKTKCVNVRFGNVIGSHGSLFPILFHQIKNNIPLTLTHPDMTRFYMSINEAVDLIFWAGENGKDGETIIKKMKAFRIDDLMKHFLKVMDQDENYPINRIGIRVGEKMHEHLITEDEIYRLKEDKIFFIIQPYSTHILQEDKIGNEPSKEYKIEEFSSYIKENLMSESEIHNYIQDFIKEHTSNNNFI